MPDFSDLLTPAAVAAAVPVGPRRPLLAMAAGVLAGAHGLDKTMIVERLGAREKLGSTGFGQGIAIPHAKLEGLDQPVGAFLRLDKPVNFAAVDDLPVDLVFALLSPTTGGAIHLKTLARVSRALRDAAFVAKLRGAGSADALFALLTSSDAA